MNVCLLAGGTGGAKLAAGLQEVLPPGALTVVANTADDEEFWGLHVSPDVDSVLYRLAGLFNDSSGWGVAGETFAAQEMMRRYQEAAWFGLGDRDLATHVLRTSFLHQGMRLTEATDELRRRLGLKTRVLPMTDDRVRTIFETDLGRLTFQEFFVREGSRPRVNRIEIAGAATARPAPEAAEAVADADLVVIGPSNPIISIAPVLALVGGFLTRHRTIAVTPLVAGKALKGPTVEMIKAVGGDPSVEGVAGSYRRSASWFVLDQRDAAAAPALAAMEYQVVVTDTVMEGPAGQRRLAEAILTALGERTLKA